MVDEPLRVRAARELPAWRLDGEEIVRELRFADFAGALAAAVRIGMLAEGADHHPELRVSWGRLEVRLTTHSSGGLTAKDLDLAGKIDRVLSP